MIHIVTRIEDPDLIANNDRRGECPHHLARKSPRSTDCDKRLAADEVREAFSPVPRDGETYVDDGGRIHVTLGATRTRGGVLARRPVPCPLWEHKGHVLVRPDHPAVVVECRHRAQVWSASFVAARVILGHVCGVVDAVGLHGNALDGASQQTAQALVLAAVAAWTRRNPSYTAVSVALASWRIIFAGSAVQCESTHHLVPHSHRLRVKGEIHRCVILPLQANHIGPIGNAVRTRAQGQAVWGARELGLTDKFTSKAGSWVMPHRATFFRTVGAIPAVR